MSIMSSHSTVPIWNLNHHQQLEAAPAGQLNNTYLYVNLHHNNNNNHILPLSSNYDEVAELTWQNGQAAMHGHSHGLAHGAAPTKPTWASFSDSLESIVHHHATLPCHNNNNNNEEMSQDLLQPNDQNSSRATAESGSSVRVPPTSAGMTKKRTRAVSDPYGGRILSSTQKETVRGDGVHTSVDVSASATLCGDDDTTLMTWASYESPSKSLMRTKTIDEDSACPRPYPHGRASEDHDDQTTKTGRSHNSSRRSRAAVVHNQSERRRRDRINQKMKALQRLVPNASKTDKASMLDEVIDYLKKLKSLLQMMGNARNNSMSQMNMMMNMMMPLQLARMGMGLGLGMGMGMLDVNTMAAATSRGAPLSLPHPLVHSASPFMVSPQAHLPSADPGGGDHRVNGVSSSANVPDPYCAFLAQSMNVESYNKMAAMLRQQVNMNNTQQATCRSRSRTSPSRQAGD